MTESNISVFNLSEVSEARKKDLLRWRLERKLDLELRDIQETSLTKKAFFAGDVLCDVAVRRFDRNVSVGDIRLLRMSNVPDASRFLYVVVLFIRKENFTSVIAPFAPYSVPACKDEWKTGISSEPLKVLQFWNAQPVTTVDLAQSWKAGELSDGHLSQARQLYKHAIEGSWPQGALREQVGLAILNPDDERLEYQKEELAVLSQMRQRLFAPVQSAQILADTQVQFSKDGELKIMDSSLVIEPQIAFAASGGDVYANVVILAGEDGKPVAKEARRDHDSANLTVDWHLEDGPELVPGLPACIYSSEYEKPLIAQGVTIGDGTTVTFTVETVEFFDRLMKKTGLWIVIQLFI